MLSNQLMRVACFAIALFSVFGKNCLTAQALPIAIDGLFEDWTSAAISLDDAVGDASGLDLLRISVANDETYLYIRFELDDLVVLNDNNDLRLFMDGDNNNLTGLASNGIGADLELRFGDREARYYFGNSSYTISLEELDFHHLPTFSNDVFEIAIDRQADPLGLAPLFSGDKIRLYLRNGTTGDRLPEQGQTFTYSFNDEPVEPFQPIDLQRLSNGPVRLMTWNTLFDGLLDSDRKPHFQQIIAVLNPDIITFNECWDMTSGQAATFMNQALPLGNLQSWKAAKLEDGNITVSRWPILQNWSVYPGRRLVASLIDLPDGDFETDFLVVNGHLRCCSANSERQLEADAFAEFILDAKSPGGSIDLAPGTPFVLSGDMNLVGDQQQYLTLLTGDIQNTNVFGNGAPLDWDGTELEDVVAIQADRRFAHTWEEPGNAYPPSRLDFHISSNSVLEAKKSFSLNTEIMSAERLAAFGLSAEDSRLASDHLPVVTDFEIKTTTAAIVSASQKFGFSASPNPSDDVVIVQWAQTKTGLVSFFIKQMDGSLLRKWDATFQAGDATETVSLKGLTSGPYLLEVKVEGRTFGLVLVKS
ncbi:MAG: hypothetical protein MUC59_06005 [Saprospiraceae bacterium]|nr:hypothetical protein [Saprospiraceae bacterium]